VSVQGKQQGSDEPACSTCNRWEKVILMKLHKIAAIAALVAAGSAHAEISLLDSSMYPTLSGTNGGTIGDVTFGTNAGKTFVQKTKADISGLGVSGGRTGDEIDMDETVGMGWANGLVITSFSVGVLYNGQEFGDWAEIAKVTARNGNTVVGVGLLQVDASDDTKATFTILGNPSGTVENLSPATETEGGGWTVLNPFGNAKVTSLHFTALESSLCGPNNRCTNQSDYILSSVTAVPEPGTYAMLLAGLGALGFMAKRRKPRA